MALIERFYLDDIEILKWQCPLCSRLSPTYQALKGHLMLDHTDSNASLVGWAKLMATEAKPVAAPRRQLLISH